MSLKAFHLVFIIAAILLALGFGAWALDSYFAAHATVWYLVAGLGSVVTAIGLVVYEIYFLKKLKNVSYL